jgi:hypothetical protein
MIAGHIIGDTTAGAARRSRHDLLSSKANRATAFAAALPGLSYGPSRIPSRPASRMLDLTLHYVGVMINRMLLEVRPAGPPNAGQDIEE